VSPEESGVFCHLYRHYESNAENAEKLPDSKPIAKHIQG
jgi:hypothetical protein